MSRISRIGQTKISDKPARQYKLTSKQASIARREYKKGMSLRTLRKKVGGSMQGTSLWMRQQKASKPMPKGLALFRQDVGAMQRARDVTWARAFRLTRDSEYWHKKRGTAFEKVFADLERRFQAGEELTDKENKRRRWLKGKIRSDKMKKWWSDNERRPKPEEMEDFLPEDEAGEYELWGE